MSVAHDEAELEMLREFFQLWQALHAIPRDQHNRRRMEQAAQRLVDCSHSLKALYKTDEKRIEVLQ